MAAIAQVHARQILDSRGNPTIEVDLTFDDGSFGRSAVPSGASTGSREALELRDGGTEYLGKSVHKAVSAVNDTLAPALLGTSLSQNELDRELLRLDGTENKSKLGANALLGVSMAYATASAASRKMPLYRYISQVLIAGTHAPSLPRPMFNIMNGGAHANWATDIQEYMIIPQGNLPYREMLRKSVEVFHHLGKLIQGLGLNTNVGNEGGYAPALQSNEQAFELILQAIAKAGYEAGKDFLLGLDVAASEFYRDGRYHLKRDNVTKTSAEMVAWLVSLARTYPLISLEDGLAESDWEGWRSLTASLGTSHQLVGDDLLVTNVRYIEQAHDPAACNALLVKLNQVGTVSETLEAMSLARSYGWNVVPSHRSGETEDVFLAHLAVGTGAGQIKTGAPSRTDRTAKYNELLRIEEELGQ